MIAVSGLDKRDKVDRSRVNGMHADVHCRVNACSHQNKSLIKKNCNFIMASGIETVRASNTCRENQFNTFRSGGSFLPAKAESFSERSIRQPY